MRRRFPLLLLALCGSLLLAGCTAVDLTVENRPPIESPTDGGSPTPVPPGDTMPSNGTLSVHFINVGQADATLLVAGNETVLIDTGDWRDDGDRVIAYLHSLGVERIDHLVATHAHADHIGGHEAVIDHYETEHDGVGATYDSGVPHTTQTYEEYLDAIERHDVPLYTVEAGDELPVDGVDASVVNPRRAGGDDLHYNAVGLHVRFGEAAFLFTGDAERDAEARMVEAFGTALEADVYQAGHHGSSSSSSGPFLDAVAPDVTVVSAAYDDADTESPYGHPHEETLRAFAERDVRTLWTAVHGTVVVETNGTALVVRAQRRATVDPLQLKGTGAVDAAPTDPRVRLFVVSAREDASSASGRLPVAAAAPGVAA